MIELHADALLKNQHVLVSNTHTHIHTHSESKLDFKERSRVEAEVGREDGDLHEEQLDEGEHRFAKTGRKAIEKLVHESLLLALHQVGERSCTSPFSDSLPPPYVHL